MKPYFELDGITIYHADCMDILPSIDPMDVDLLLTDPPYGIGYDPGEALTRAGTKWVGVVGHPPVVGDAAPFNPEALLTYKRIVLWGANNYADKLPPSQSWIVWNRDSGDSHTADAELAWTNLGGTVRSFDYLWNGVCRGSEIGNHWHPTQKPVALMRWILERWTKPGDLILDPYMGSGPIAQACFELGRRYVGIEIEESYCQITVERRFNQQTLFAQTNATDVI